MLLVPRHEGEYAKVGTVAEVGDRVRMPGGGRAVSLAGLHRAELGAAHTDPQGSLRVEVDGASRRGAAARPRPASSSASTAPRSRRSSSCAATTAASRPSSARSATWARSPTRSRTRPTSASSRRSSCSRRSTSSSGCELALRLQRERLAEMQVRRRIREDVEEGAAKQQREYILRQARWSRSARSSARTTRPSPSDYRTKIAEAGMPDAVREQAEREVARLERMGDQSAESSMIRTYLDWLLAVPWGEALRGAARPGLRPRGARRRPRRARRT